MPDSISQIFSSAATPSSGGGGVGGFPSPGTGSSGLWPNILRYALLGSTGAGTVGNILANRTRNQVLGQQMNYTKYLQNLAPADIVRMITSMEQPLSQNLIHNVTNTVSGQLAERGLSQAPGIQAQAIAQGIAPYQLQEQQLAQQALFQKLGLPISARPSPFGPFPQTTNTSQLWQALSSRFMGGQGNGAPFQPNIGPGLGASAPGIDSWLPTSSSNPYADFTSLLGLVPSPSGSAGTGQWGGI